MATWEERAASFNRIAQQYDRMRPAYPSELYNDLVWMAGLTPERPILEIGCGPGKFTQPLAERSLTIDALEPGTSLAAYATDKLSAWPGVQVINASFEAFQAHRRYHLIVAASSFHWLDVATRFQRCADLLEPAGWLAICGIGPRRGPDNEAFLQAAEAIYREVAPALEKGHGTAHGEAPRTPGGPRGTEPSPLFENVAHKTYPWKAVYSSQDYVQLLDTYSDHQTLAPVVKTELYRRLVDLADAEFGGHVTRHYETRLDLRRLALTQG